VFSTFSIAQFWSLAADVMNEAEGKRLFPLIAAGGTIGGIAGAQIAARAIRWLHPYQLMLVAAALLAVCMFLTRASHRAGLGHRTRVPNGVAKARDSRGGFTLVVRDRYLLLIAVSVLLLNLINTTGDFILAKMVDARAQLVPADARHRFIGEFYGDFQTYVSVLTAVVQIVLVARVFKVLGIGSALFVLPLLAVTGYGASAVMPALAVVAAVKVFENSTDYSLQNTLQQALFLPTSRDAKYKAKSAIDTVSVRLGDLASTGLVFIGAQLHLGVLGYSIANIAAALLWVWVAVYLRRRQMALVATAKSAAPARPAVPAPQPVTAVASS
jgi:ATP:ADP antiporter, AAA family